MTPTSVFALGRMRHLDLLALWHQLNPDNAEVRAKPFGAVTGTGLAISKEGVAAAVLAGT